MRIAILETGQPPAEIMARFGDYPAMFRRLLGEEAHDYTTYPVARGALPVRPEVHDAYVVTGSAAGVYEPHGWIEPLKGFLRAARPSCALVGVCFGHQIMAEAFGGKVTRSPRGWGVGLHSYRLVSRASWMDPVAETDSFRAPASHQDQVCELPPQAEVLAASEFTPFGMLSYRGSRAISIQLHPEFDPAYACALIENRRGVRYTDPQADAAIASYADGDDRALLGAWIGNFLARGVP